MVVESAEKFSQSINENVRKVVLQSFQLSSIIVYEYKSHVLLVMHAHSLNVNVLAV